jgi:hypothetical protein
MLPAMPLAPPARLGLAGGLFVLLVVAALLADGWARGPASRVVRRPKALAPLVEVKPAIVRHYGPTRPLQRAGAAARALLGVALLGGVALHLRRGGRARAAACGAALLAATWALGTAFHLATRAFDAPYLRVALGTQSGGFTLYDLYLALAVLLAAAAGLVAARRRPPASPPDPPGSTPTPAVATNEQARASSLEPQV